MNNHSKSPSLPILTLLPLLLILSFPALAQNSTQSPPPSAAKEGGVEGDPSGAIRSLEGTDTAEKPKGTDTVTIPQLGAKGGGASRTGSVPAGTTR